MIAPSIVQQVRRMLATGKFSQRTIARLTGISRGTVCAISTGRRPDYQPPPPPSDGPPRRCPGCGGLVHMPCRLCRARAFACRFPSPPATARSRPAEEPLGLDLREAERARYDEIRQRRERAEAIAARPKARFSPAAIGTEHDCTDGATDVELDQPVLEPADLRDAFDWEEEDPAIDYPAGSALDAIHRHLSDSQ